MSEDTFRQDWGFPSEVRQTIPDAAYHGTDPVPGTYKSGRARFETSFLSRDRKVVARRPAMELTSKKTGKPYFVCRREADSWPSTSAQPKAAAANFSLDDVLDEIA